MKKLSICQACWILTLLLGVFDVQARTIDVAKLHGGIEVLQYLADANGRALAVLSGGQDKGITTGDLFETFRLRGGASNPLGINSLRIQTGKLKALEVHQGTTLAAVLEDGSPLSERLLERFAGVMAGDIAVAIRPELIAQQSLAPTLSLTYDELFVDAKAMPTTFELSTEGREKLRELASKYGNRRLSKLLIEGHTDAHGPSQANQVESYQRAMTVRQFLISELGFDAERTVAIGFGQTEPLDDDRVPGYRRTHRRIVLKPVNL